MRVPHFKQLTSNFFLGKHYTSISDHREKIKWIIHQEEIQYMKTLQSAYKAMSKLVKRYQKEKLGTQVNEVDTFNLWNTHGLPKEAIEEEFTRLGKQFSQIFANFANFRSKRKLTIFIGFTGDFSKF